MIAPRKLFRVEDFHNGLAFVTTEDRDTVTSTRLGSTSGRQHGFTLTHNEWRRWNEDRCELER